MQKNVPEKPAFCQLGQGFAQLARGSAGRLDSGPMSRTFLATLHFDGTGFVGWQRQPAGRSVQVEFERVLERLFEQRAVAHAAGRTDAGVHAIGLGVSFAAPRQAGPPPPPPRPQRAPAQGLLGRVGAPDAAGLPRPEERHLPPLSLRHRPRRRGGVALSPALRVGARTSARPRRAPLRGDARSSASTTSAPLPPRASPSRTTAAASRGPSGCRGPRAAGSSFHVEADRFLHHMVRMLVGTMVDVGLERRPLADIEALLERGDNQETSPPAPPQGLYFVAATYPDALYADEAEEAHAGVDRGVASALLLAAGATACDRDGRPRRRAAEAGGAGLHPGRAGQHRRPRHPPDAIDVPAHRAGRRPPSAPRAPWSRSTPPPGRRRGRARPGTSSSCPSGPRLVQGYGTGFVIRPERRHRHQPARGRQRGAGGGDPGRRHRPPRHGAGRGSAHRHRGAPGEAPGTLHGDARPEHRPHDRRVGRRAGQSLRLPARERGADGHRRRGERHRPQHPAERRADRSLPRHDPDRRRDQPGQLGRPAHQCAGRSRRASTPRSSATAAARSASGFAIPIERALRVADEIIQHGTVRRAWVGLEVEGAAAMRNWKSAGRRHRRRASRRVARRPRRRSARATCSPRPTAGRSGTISTGRRSSSTSTSATRSTCRCGAARQTARRRIVTGDLPTVTAEKFTRAPGSPAHQRHAGDPGRARDPERGAAR